MSDVPVERTVDTHKAEMVKNIAMEILNILNVRGEEKSTEEFHAGQIAINVLILVVGNAIKNLSPKGLEQKGIEVFFHHLNAWMADVEGSTPEKIDVTH